MLLLQAEIYGLISAFFFRKCPSHFLSNQSWRNLTVNISVKCFAHNVFLFRFNYFSISDDHLNAYRRERKFLSEVKNYYECLLYAVWNMLKPPRTCTRWLLRVCFNCCMPLLLVKYQCNRLGVMWCFSDIEGDVIALFKCHKCIISPCKSDKYER